MKQLSTLLLLGAASLLLSSCMATNPDTLNRKQIVWLHPDGTLVSGCRGWMGLKEHRPAKRHNRHHRAVKKEAAKKDAPKKTAVNPPKKAPSKSAE